MRGSVKHADTIVFTSEWMTKWCQFVSRQSKPRQYELPSTLERNTTRQDNSFRKRNPNRQFF